MKSLFVVTIAVIVFTQTLEQNQNQYIRLFGRYDNCTGYFQKMVRLGLSSGSGAGYPCNDETNGTVRLINADYAIGFVNEQAYFLSFIRDYVSKYINGDHYYKSYGNIIGGKCNGASVYFQSIEYVSAGSCQSPEGVTQAQSPSNESLLFIDGKCWTKCYGTYYAQYMPGMRDE